MIVKIKTAKREKNPNFLAMYNVLQKVLDIFYASLLFFPI